MYEHDYGAQIIAVWTWAFTVSTVSWRTARIDVSTLAHRAPHCYQASIAYGCTVQNVHSILYERKLNEKNNSLHMRAYNSVIWKYDDVANKAIL